MKTRKLFLVSITVVILLLITVFGASAGGNIRITGGINQTYFGFGWEWVNVNVSLEPGSGETEGLVSYRVYVGDKNTKLRESWTGEPVCGAFDVVEGVPTMTLVIKIVEQKNIDPDWVGKYLKMTLTDGGENASADILGIVVWDFLNNKPVDLKPQCDYEGLGFTYYGDNGNIKIHR